MCKSQFLKYFSEESCKSCVSTQKANKCVEFDECSASSFEYFKAGFDSNKINLESDNGKIIQHLKNAFYVEDPVLDVKYQQIPSHYSLTKCLQELKSGRTSIEQNFLQECIDNWDVEN